MLEEERKLVLNMLAEGKITPEQAAELLRALNDTVGAAEIHEEEMPSGIGEDVRQALRQAREAAREAGRTAREEARRARNMAREAAREARRHLGNSGFDVDLSGVGSFVDNLVNRITGEFAAFGHRWEDTYEGSFTSGSVALDLVTTNGSIRCSTWDGSSYKLVVGVRAGGADEAEARRRAGQAIRVEHGPDGITVRVEDGWMLRVAADLELLLPAAPDYHLRASTGNGSITLENGRFADARLRTGNGSIHNSATVADLEATTGNGSIRAEARGAGQWGLSTGNGSVTVDTGRLGDTALEVNASTGAGRIHIDIPGAATQQGGLGHVSVRLSTPGFEQASSRLSVRARTGLGSISFRPVK